MGSARFSTLRSLISSSGKSPICPLMIGVAVGLAIEPSEPGLEHPRSRSGPAAPGSASASLIFCSASAMDCSLLPGGEQHRRRGHRVGEVRVESGLVDAVEEAEERVEILLGDRVVLVVVAPRALEGQPQERGSEGDGAVGDVLGPPLLLDRSPLVGLAVVPVEGRGQDLLAGSDRARGRRRAAR